MIQLVFPEWDGIIGERNDGFDHFKTGTWHDC